MLTKSIRAKQTGMMIVGLLIGFVFGGIDVASAQVYIIDPDTLPDVGVRVNAPKSVLAYDVNYLTIKVDSQAPLKGFFRSYANSVNVTVDFTGLGPIYVSADSGLACRWLNGSGSDWTMYNCSGSLPYGSTATIQVWFIPSSSFYCGRPTYTDAAVTMSGGERTSSNNRSIARTDLTGCIG